MSVLTSTPLSVPAIFREGAYADAPPMGPLANTIFIEKYSFDGVETWAETAHRTVSNVVGPYFPELVDEITALVRQRKFLPGGRYLRNAGRPYHQVNNCALFDVEDSREGWADLMKRITQSLMTGCGIGIVYSKLRGEGEPVKGMGGTSTGPIALMQMVNEAGRHIMQGGARRSAIWAGLHWNHPDVFKFISLKDWDDEVSRLKTANFSFPACLDHTNISVILDDDFFSAYENETDRMHAWAQMLYRDVVRKMLTTGEPGFSVDIGVNAGENLRNACCELTSRDNNDICNLGSINLARIDSLAEMQRVTELGTVFLLCGTLYSTLPIEEMEWPRIKNRRLGLGLMGLYEWLVTRGKPYSPDRELGQWLSTYATSTEIAAKYADRLGISRPVKTRSIAPNGTIGMIAETTTGIEPLFAQAYKRRYLKGGKNWVYQYVIDSTTERLVEKGVTTEHLVTAYDLAQDPEQRINFQAWVQQYVDHAISSTLNLPAPDEQSFTDQEFGDMLMKYLPHLRGITAYPNGARGGQPLTGVSYEEAHGQTGVEYDEVGNSEACASGVCGI